MAKQATKAQKIARAQKAAARRELEQTMVLQAMGNGTSSFFQSLMEQSLSGRYLSKKQMAIVERVIAEKAGR